MLRKLCLPFSPYRQRPDITIHGPGVPRTAIPAQRPSGMLPQVRRGKQAATSPVSGELTTRPGDSGPRPSGQPLGSGKDLRAATRTHAPDKLPSARSSHESPIRLISCLSSPGGGRRPAGGRGLRLRSPRIRLMIGLFRRHCESLSISASAPAGSRHRHSAGITVSGWVGYGVTACPPAPGRRDPVTHSDAESARPPTRRAG